MPAEWAFVNIFAAFLLVDFVNYRIRTVMIAHHVVCLIGHFGALSAPAAFVDYFAAAVACELGSAVCNLNALYRGAHALAAYVAGMTLSNGLALAALLSWARALGGAASGCASRCHPHAPAPRRAPARLHSRVAALRQED